MIQAIKILQGGFTQPLPGTNAQSRMSPSVRFTGTHTCDPQFARESSVFILLYKEDGQWYIPLIKRHDYQGVHSGQISLPGGKREPEDTSLLHTAYRETEEEIGIKQEAITYIGSLTELYIPNSNFNVLPQVGLISETPVLTPDPREVQDIIRFPLSALFEPSSIQHFSKEINNVPVSAPFYNINNHEVWGATAMILSEFSELVKSCGFLGFNPRSHSYNDHSVQECQ